MSLKSIFKTLVKAAPVIVVHAPSVIAAVKQVMNAMKTDKASR